MDNEETELTQQQIIDNFMAIFRTTLSTLSAEKINLLYVRRESLVREFNDATKALATPESVDHPAHQNIRIFCTIGNRNYIACGFLSDSEGSVSGITMLSRTDINNTKPIDKEDSEHITKHLADFDNYPELDLYALATTQRYYYSKYLTYIAYLSAKRVNARRQEYMCSLEVWWSHRTLVLRRLV